MNRQCIDISLSNISLPRSAVSAINVPLPVDGLGLRDRPRPCAACARSAVSALEPVAASSVQLSALARAVAIVPPRSVFSVDILLSSRVNKKFIFNLHCQWLLSWCNRTLHVFALVHKTHVTRVGQRLRTVIVLLVADVRRCGLLSAYK